MRIRKIAPFTQLPECTPCYPHKFIFQSLGLVQVFKLLKVGNIERKYQPVKSTFGLPQAVKNTKPKEQKTK